MAPTVTLLTQCLAATTQYLSPRVEVAGLGNIPYTACTMKYVLLRLAYQKYVQEIFIFFFCFVILSGTLADLRPSFSWLYFTTYLLPLHIEDIVSDLSFFFSLFIEVLDSNWGRICSLPLFLQAPLVLTFVLQSWTPTIPFNFLNYSCNFRKKNNNTTRVQYDLVFLKLKKKQGISYIRPPIVQPSLSNFLFF